MTHARTPASPSRRGRRALAAAALAAGLATPLAAVPAAPAAAVPAGATWALDFDQSLLGGLLPSDRVTDVTGRGNDGRVRLARGGALRSVVGALTGSRALQFPAACSGAACPAAVVKVPDAAVLVPRTRPFAYGARLRLPAAAVTHGANVVQKGLWGDRGQWKLQVDDGRPGCVVAGQHDGDLRRAVVAAPRSIADGRWHELECRRTATAVELVVDGAVAARQAAPAVDVRPGAAVAVGGKGVSSSGDQFHGALDEVWLRVG
ncbi:LamG-like jellyroll fold domain-containing protein [Vallicoccus soli]|uniref:LamG domain-containing protein n=1 Tax=Vallicoccus soli TaxID=2339232 RepID=A0A3A3Z4K9_9ACTN|nr:LamG-like jellyroll fold domain-containing protein [Vallicoccus soli]RJK97903.1 LamG domain-containing protein [Vallicoccus soli]